MPIAHIYDEITKALEKGDLTCGIYLDLKKAFDTVCYDILLAKIKHIGIQGKLYELLCSYLPVRRLQWR